MEFVYLLLVNLIFCGLVFFYFQRKYESTIQSGKIKRELEELVILFNQQAEKNIVILETKVKEVKEITKSLEKSSEKILEKRKSPIKARKEMVNYSVYPTEEIDKVEDVAIISKKKLLKPKAGNKVQKSVNKTNKKKNLIDELKLEYQAGVSKKKLAKKFNLSVEEVNLRLNLNRK